MKVFFIFLTLLAIVLAAFPFFDQDKKTELASGLPWQIEQHADGSTSVFGLHIGESSLLDAVAILGDDMELAVVAAPDEVGSLEMYFGHFRSGLLSGKLVLQTSIDELEIKAWREKSSRFEHMASGQAKKFFFEADDAAILLEKTITGITFIPAVNLDAEVVITRFGEPDEKVQLSGATHFLYPEKGLDVVLYEDSKDVLQYVSPANFQQLVQPIQ